MLRGFIVLMCLTAVALAGVHLTPRDGAGIASSSLEVGFGTEEVTPELAGERPVYLAGFRSNRKATAVHDPLFARAVVFRSGERKIALVAVDVIGLFHPVVEHVRSQLPGFDYVLVSSTHVHEGPDTLGLWGPSPVQSGVDADYLVRVEKQIVRAVKSADASRKAVKAHIGVVQAPDLVYDNREPTVKQDELIALAFRSVADDSPAGVLVQWNCHPETLDAQSTQITADFVGYAIKDLERIHHCPAVFFNGAVGGLMTTMHLDVKDADGKVLPEGTFAKTARYGTLVAETAGRALKDAKPLTLTPLAARSRAVFLPLDNKLYVAGRKLGVLDRPAYVWIGDSDKAEPAAADHDGRLCLRTETACLQLGDLEIAAIPGEIYPELVLGRVQDPVDVGADFPDAPVEPAIYAQLHAKHHLIIGLANDEIGYIIPKRQWDEKAPYCYGRKQPQYGEKNSLGPDTAPLLCRAFQKVAARDK